MARSKTSAREQHHPHAMGAAALLIVQKALETLVKHGLITKDQLTEIYESARQEHEEKRHAFGGAAIHEKVTEHIRHASEGHWPPDDIQ